MSVRIAFGIITARENVKAVTQLVDAIGPNHPIFIHHDYSKQPDFRIRRSNVQFVANPVVTQWGSWEFSEAILLAMRTALSDSSINYFQLLSGTCLPVRPIEEFERFVECEASDVNMDVVSIDEDSEAMMSHGFRLFAASDTLRHRLLRRTRDWYYDSGAHTVQISGLGIRKRNDHEQRASLPARAQIARKLIQIARQGYLFKHPYGQIWLPYIGSTWFGCKPEVAEFIAYRAENDPTLAYMREAALADELYFQTLVGNSPFSVGPSNHLINDFVGSHPLAFEMKDTSRIRASGKFFARKFNDNPTDETRTRILKERSTAIA